MDFSLAILPTYSKTDSSVTSLNTSIPPKELLLGINSKKSS